MIFVTVGTHEQQFDRLIEEVDRLKREGIITEEIIMQIGFSTYEPKYCRWSRLLSYDEMQQRIAEARIVITHGGPASFVAPLQIGKIPIVVPRQKKFDEHVNDHQLEFCKAVAERQGNILLVDEVETLGETITNYDDLVAVMSTELKSNNEAFCDNMETLVRGMIN